MAPEEPTVTSVPFVMVVVAAVVVAAVVVVVDVVFVVVAVELGLSLGDIEA